MDIHRNPVQAAIAQHRSASAKKVTLLATDQGRNETVGVCYPPIEKSVDLVLP